MTVRRSGERLGWFLLMAVLCCSAFNATQGQTTVLWSDGFETEYALDDWFSDRGVWETVLESNLPPVCPPLAPLAVCPNQPIRFRVRALDPDCPEQKLTYSLGEGAPPGAVIDPDTGELTWTPDAAQSATFREIAIVATDDWLVPSSTLMKVSLVRCDSRPRLRVAPGLNGAVRVALEGAIEGAEYVLEATAELRVPPALTDWKEVAVLKAGSAFYEDSETTAAPARFFRYHVR